MVLRVSDDSVVVVDRERNSKLISAFCLLGATAWGGYWLWVGVYPFLLIGLPVILVLAVAGLSNVLTSRETEFIRSTHEILVRRRIMQRCRTDRYQFADFDRVLINQHVRSSTPRASTYRVSLRHKDANVEYRFLPLGPAYDESDAWNIANTICDATGITSLRTVKRNRGERNRPALKVKA